jgi:magnesium chelatase family protein
MLAERLPGLLPALTPEESLVVTRVHSAAGCLGPDGTLLTRPPFRAPHHRASIVALVGGGSWSLRPGEISLATHGVLFLDEMGEFPVAALESLRQPLEEGVIRVSRAGGTVTFPAEFLLVAAMNPCPCGEGVFEGACQCTAAARARYTRRLSAPLLDRFDLVVPLFRPDPDQLLGGIPGPSTASAAVRVAAARAHAASRRKSGKEGRDRGRGRGSDVAEGVAGLDDPPLHPDGARLLAAKLREGTLTARGLHKVARVARTVADLEGAEQVGEEHVCDALSLRTARSVVVQ